MTRLVVHTGVPVSGMDAVRARLAGWREPLASGGVLLLPNERPPQWDRAVQQLTSGETPPTLRRLAEQHSSDDATFLVSSETAYRPLRRGRTLRHLRDFGARHGMHVRVLLAVREQLDLLNELYCRQIAAMEPVESFDALVAKGVGSGLYHYARAFRALHDADDIDVVAIPYSMLRDNDAARVVLAASGVPKDVVDGLPDSRMPWTESPLPGPVLLTALVLLRKRLTRLGIESPTALTRAAALLRGHALHERWDDEPFWGWRADAAEVVTQEFRHDNAEFAAGAWHSDWPDPPPSRRRTPPDLANRASDLVVDVLDTLHHVVEDVTGASMPRRTA